MAQIDSTFHCCFPHLTAVNQDFKKWKLDANHIDTYINKNLQITPLFSDCTFLKQLVSLTNDLLLAN